MQAFLQELLKLSLQQSLSDMCPITLQIEAHNLDEDAKCTLRLLV